MNAFVAFAVTALLLMANAYFVACEFAVMGARRSRIEPMVDEGRPGAKQVLYALEKLTLMLATCQLGVTVCSVALGAVSEPAIAHLIEKPLELMHVPHALTHPIAFVIALVIVVFLHVVAGEMVPKNVTITHPETLALILVPLLVVVSKLLYPLVAFLNWLANYALRIFGIEPKDEVDSAFTADEVASIVDVSEKAGVLNADAELLSGALEFSECSAADVMVPLADLAIVRVGVSVAEFEDLAGRTGFSRFPVQAVHGGLIGYLHLKDVLDVPSALRGEAIPLGKVRPLPSVPDEDEVESALRAMQCARTHMASVMRNGEMIGVLFLEDILEELVGEVRDAMQRH